MLTQKVIIPLVWSFQICGVRSSDVKLTLKILFHWRQ